jgi:hypothetical protein
LVEFHFTDDTKEMIKLPAEIWRYNEQKASKVFMFEKEVKAVALDPYLETADCELYDNNWPRKTIPSRFDLFKQNQE